MTSPSRSRFAWKPKTVALVAAVVAVGEFAVAGWARLAGAAFGPAPLAVAGCFSLLVAGAVAALHRADLDRGETEDARRESEARFRHLADALPQIVWAADPSGRTTYMNGRWTEYTGLRGAGPDDSARVIHPDDIGPLNDAWEEARRAEREYQAEFRLRPAADGPYRWFLARAVPVRGREGRVLEWLGTSTDIDDLKRAAESQRQFRQLAESLPQLVWTDRPDGYCDYLSPQWVSYTGIPEAEQLGYGWVNQLHPDDRAAAAAAWDRAVATGTTFEAEFRIRRADGVYRWFQTRGVAAHNAGGAVVKWFGTNTDIEDRKRAAEALRESEARFHRTFDGMLEGCQIIGFDWRYLYVNDSVAVHARRAKEELVGRTMMEMYPGIENTAVFAVLRRCMEERTSHRVENRFEYPDGHTAWFDLSVQPGPEGIFVLSADITARKRAEEALREKNALLHAADRRLAKLVTGMSEACFLLDAEWRFTFVNDRGETLFRHRRADVLGRSIWEVFHKLVGTPMEGHYRRAMAERVPVSFVAFSPIAERWVDIRLFPTGDGLAAFLLDIHDRKRGEEALRASEERFRGAFERSNVAMVLTDVDNRFLRVNEAFARLFGYTEAELLTMDLADVTHPDHLAESYAHRRELVTRAASHFEMEKRYLHKDGRVLWGRTNVALVRDAEGAPSTTSARCRTSRSARRPRRRCGRRKRG